MATNWSNIDFSNPRERNLNVIEGLTFEDLLTEINCNLPEINASTVTEQFEKDLKNRIEEARWVFNSNLKNIIRQGNKERK